MTTQTPSPATDKHANGVMVAMEGAGRVKGLGDEREGEESDQGRGGRVRGILKED